MVKKMHASPAPSPANKKAGSSRKSGATSSGPQDSALAKSVKESAQHIWLAGMGAFSKAQEEGTKVFEALVKEGQSLQRKTQAVAEEKIGEVTGKMTSMAGTVQAKANQNWDKLEGIFEARTAKALSKLGVPTAKDVEALIQRVDELATAVARLSRQGTGTVRTTPTRATKTAKATQTAAAPSDAKKVPRKVAKTAPRTASKTAVKTALKTPAKRARKSALAAAGV